MRRLLCPRRSSEALRHAAIDGRLLLGLFEMTRFTQLKNTFVFFLSSVLIYKQLLVYKHGPSRCNNCFGFLKHDSTDVVCCCLLIFAAVGSFATLYLVSFVKRIRCALEKEETIEKLKSSSTLLLLVVVMIVTTILEALFATNVIMSSLITAIEQTRESDATILAVALLVLCAVLVSSVAVGLFVVHLQYCFLTLDCYRANKEIWAVLHKENRDQMSYVRNMRSRFAPLSDCSPLSEGSSRDHELVWVGPSFSVESHNVPVALSIHTVPHMNSLTRSAFTCDSDVDYTLSSSAY